MQQVNVLLVFRHISFSIRKFTHKFIKTFGYITFNALLVVVNQKNDLSLAQISNLNQTINLY